MFTFIKKNYAIFVIVLITSSLTLFLTSNSPIYKYNQIGDSSIYTHVGYNWLFGGKVPYKDLFDHKGPLHFLLFGIFSIIKFKTMYPGIWLLDTIILASTSILLFKCSQIVLKSTKISLLVILGFQLLLFGTVDFTNIAQQFDFKAHSISTGVELLTNMGGTPEQFCLPFISYILYLVLKYKNMSLDQVSSKHWILFGLCVSAIFLEKFTLALPFILIMVIVTIISFTTKVKVSIKNIAFAILAFIGPILLFVLYFKLSGALSDFVTYYFKVNIFNYSVEDNASVFEKVLLSLKVGLSMLKSNIILLVPFLVALSGFIFTKSENKTASYVIMLMFSFEYVCSLISIRFYSHYLLPLLPFVFIGLVFVVSKFKFENIAISYNIKLLLVSIIVFALCIGFSGVSITSSVFHHKLSHKQIVDNAKVNNAKLSLSEQYSEAPIERVAKIIKNDKGFDKSKTNILQFYSLNSLVHTLTGTEPKTRFFYRPLMYIKSYDKELLEQIQTKQPNYIVTRVAPNTKGDEVTRISKLAKTLSLRNKFKIALSNNYIIYKKVDGVYLLKKK